MPQFYASSSYGLVDELEKEIKLMGFTIPQKQLTV
jgi:hypothetical protein